MGFTLTAAPKKRIKNPHAPRKKTASRDFFVNTPKTRQGNRPQPLKTQQETTPYSYKITSGRPVWPSRDPIGERGGLNLYGFVGNNGINTWDILGKDFGGFVDYWKEKLQDGTDACCDLVDVTNDAIVEAEERAGQCICDKLDKLGINRKWAVSVNAGAKTIVGSSGGSSSLEAVFFASSCEVALYGVQSTNGEIFDEPIGFDFSAGFTGSIAMYTGSGAADAASWEGNFNNVNVEYVGNGGAVFWGGGWSGAGVSIGAGATVFSLETTKYVMIGEPQKVPKSVCCGYILAAGLKFPKLLM